MVDKKPKRCYSKEIIEKNKQHASGDDVIIGNLMWCLCMQGTGILRPYTSDKNIKMFSERFRMITTYVYEHGEYVDTEREFILIDEEYKKQQFLSKLKG